MLSGNVVPILDISPKQSNQIFLQQKQIVPTAKQKLSDIEEGLFEDVYQS